MPIGSSYWIIFELFPWYEIFENHTFKLKSNDEDNQNKNTCSWPLNLHKSTLHWSENCQNESILEADENIFVNFSHWFWQKFENHLKPHRGEILNAFGAVGCQLGRCECCWMPAVRSISSVFIWTSNCLVDISLRFRVNRRI